MNIRMPRVALFLACFMTTCFSGVMANDQTKQEKLRSIVEAYSNNGMFQGSVLIAQGDDILFTNANLDEQMPKYEIASIAKQFTVVLGFRLQANGLLDLDGYVGDYIPSLKPELGKAIKVRHLLSHRSGLPRDFVPNRTGMDLSGLTSAQKLDFMNKLSLQSTPGEGKSYSNAGFSLFSLVVEHVTGLPYDAALRKHLLAPLELNDTGVLGATLPEGLQWGQNYLHDEVISIPSRPQPWAIGNGAMYSTVLDLFRWERALVSGKAVSKEDFAEMLSNNLGLFKYNYNWPGNEGEKGRAYTHSGANEGFAANVTVYIEHELTVATLSNRHPSQISNLYNQLANSVLGFDEPLPTDNLTSDLYKILFDDSLEAAVEFYETLRQEDRWDTPNHIMMNRVGYLYLENGRLENAVEAFRLFTRAYPKKGNAWDSLGEAYFATAQYSLSKEAYERALELNPANGGAQAMLVKIATMLGECD